MVLNIQIKKINRNDSLHFYFSLIASDSLVMILHTWSTLHVSLMSSPVVILMSLYPIMLALKTKNMCLYGSVSKPYSRKTINLLSKYFYLPGRSVAFEFVFEFSAFRILL